MNTRLLGLSGLIFICFTMLVVPLAPADERIIHFDSNIQIHADRSMTVTETILVLAQGKQIRRGIYRDFPTDYKDKLGNRYRVAFEVQSVLNNGVSEEFKTERINNGIRVYVGKPDVLLPSGEYRFEITYKTDRQLGFFAEHDELYWNVTGSGWNFRIDRATAAIKLPEYVAPSELNTTGYTGPQGAVEQNFEAFVDDLGVAHFETSAALNPHEGLTVVLAWPKGIISPPKTTDRVAATLSDNVHVLVALVGSLGLALYYLFTWDRVGRDPASGVIVAEYEPPPGYSPASMRYIEKMAYDDKCLSAALINLAVKGYLTIEETAKAYTLLKTGKETDLAPGERALVSRLFTHNNAIEIKQSNHATIGEALDAHEQALSDDYQNKYFKTNRKFFFIGAALSVFLIVLTAVVATSTTGFHETFFMATWSSIWWFGTGAGLVKSWDSIRHAHSTFTRITALIRVIFLLPFVAAGIAVLFLFGGSVNWTVIIFLLLVIVLNIVFYQLLKAPTRLGRKLLDKVEGFRHYVNVAEKHELDYRNPAGRTPALFEKYLPYALALDIEQQWTDQFHDVFAATTGGDSHYRPSWYSGANWHPTRASHFSSSLAGSLTSAIASASTAPGSSSGSGGGGFSGGGGGGGGGGGW